ncbi:hypothetical protein NLJ89_g9235 [Agrocybe chaxingu]|uniref:RING-type E3 ubiquitin transferase n=1 Tax=Agrocybe chaxingu TaxID=84603 RepID=A0A9W8MRF2_9AGAR|nr:hypothetical protein NLJ89_g9235 [Agrocybe chaxingu]
MSSASTSRPVTSKSRGVCKYYNAPRGCFAGDKCKFLHCEPPASPKLDDPPLLTPHDKSKRCRYYAEGFCKRGDACWFLHTSDSKDKRPAANLLLDEEEDEFCSICFEKPTTYGLLGGCSHIFCIVCIKQWRDPQNKPGGVLDSGNTKKCPMCRSASKFITPSSKFWKDGTPEKEKVVQNYKDSMARVPCRYFQKSLQKNKRKPICPYGKDCFYQHVMEDGTPFVFKEGVDESMRRYRSSQGSRVYVDNLHFMPFLNMASLDLAGMTFDGQDVNRRRGTNPIRNTTRRLQEVQRSLEILNDVINEGATTGNLNRAVQALQAGFGRTDGGGNQSRTNRRQEDREEAAEMQEDEVMEQLGVLADQMLASLGALRDVQDERSDTPPPPLEPIHINEDAPRRPAARDSDDESVGSMPDLQSVSNTSESEYDEFDDDDEDSSDEESDYLGDVLAGGDLDGDRISANAMVDVFRSMLAADQLNHPTTTTSMPPPPPEPQPSPRFSTTVGRSMQDADEEGDELPELEEVDSRGSERSGQGEENKEPSRPTEGDGLECYGHPPPDRAPSPEKLDASGKVKISGPMNGAPIPSGFKFGGKDTPSADSSSASANNDRREKAKSRSFWGFGKGDKGQPHATFTPRAVFGVPLEEALEVAQVCNLPAIVFRSIQYLQAKKADQEEGIYRLSGSSAVIKSLKDRFNNEGDVDLLASDEYWDPHAIAGLLKSFLRELPSSILTRDLHLKFLAVIVDFVDPQERIKELSQLIAALPLANYSLLRALTAHLILIVQNSNVNKMTMRNVGIVFSPTLGIPAGVFSLMLGEFNRVFDVDADTDDSRPKEGGGLLEHPSEALRRNSRQYTDAAADQVLGLSGRTLSTSAEETQSDGDDFSIQDESGTETTEGDATVESSSSSPASVMMQRDHGIQINTPDSTPNTPTAKTTSRAANVAASRGLNVAVTTSERGNRHSRMMGLPLSPRPHTQSHSPSRGDPPSNNSPTPARSE